MPSERKLMKKILKYQDRLDRCRRYSRRDRSRSTRSRDRSQSRGLSRSPVRSRSVTPAPSTVERERSRSPQSILRNNQPSESENSIHDTPVQGSSHECNTLEPYREALGTDYEEPNRFEGEIHEDIAKRWLHILKNGITKQERDELLKKHKIPQNCKLIEAPTLNMEVKAVLTESSKLRDKSIEAQQHQIGIATAIIGKTITSLIGRTEKENITMFKDLSEATKLLADINNNQTKTRRLLIALLLDKSFNQMIEKTKRDEHLYGDNLAEKIKTNKLIQQSSTQIKKPAPKPATAGTFKNKSGNQNCPSRQYTSSVHQPAKAMARGGPKSLVQKPSQQQRSAPQRRPERTQRGAHKR